MKIKLTGTILITVMLIAQGMAQTFSVNLTDVTDEANKVANWAEANIPAIVPTPNIKLENSITEVGFPDLSGFHPDCTFTLNNTGNGNGFATVDLKTDSGALLRKEEFPVPKNTATTYHMKVNMSLLPIPGSDSVKYNIESTRSATPDESKNAMEYALNQVAKFISTMSGH